MHGSLDTAHSELMLKRSLDSLSAASGQWHIPHYHIDQHEVQVLSTVSYTASRNDRFFWSFLSKLSILHRDWKRPTFQQRCYNQDTEYEKRKDRDVGSKNCQVQHFKLSLVPIHSALYISPSSAVLKIYSKCYTIQSENVNIILCRLQSA